MIKHIVLVAVVALMTTACGYRGGLERPAPLWGPERAKWEAEQKAKAEAEEKKNTSPPVATPAPK